MGLSRRNLSGLVGLGATGTILASSLKKFSSPLTQAKSLTVNRFGELQPDPQGILGLPLGFQSKIISAVGETMDDGIKAIRGKNGTTILIRNHELSPLQGSSN